MTTLAKKFKDEFDETVNLYVQLDSIAAEKNQDYQNEKTWWIFEDGSAIGIDSFNKISIKTNYGRNVDHEQLK
jgi:hypothetical protein